MGTLYDTLDNGAQAKRMPYSRDDVERLVMAATRILIATPGGPEIAKLELKQRRHHDLHEALRPFTD